MAFLFFSVAGGQTHRIVCIVSNTDLTFQLKHNYLGGTDILAFHMKLMNKFIVILFVLW